jgi:hypothetical protein
MILIKKREQEQELYFLNFAVTLVFIKRTETLTMTEFFSMFEENTKIQLMVCCKMLVATRSKMLLS